ncbi:MAG: TatD family hydrolase [Gemmatimonadaceae bacterium]|jgi:TatD DNase family protein|nr:TatD family hydrolase [Gemmatimonadaceae bacterium]
MEFADSHVHLGSEQFRDDVDDVIARARDAGARAIVCIGESPAMAERAAGIAARYPELVAFTAGLHPHDAQHWRDDETAPALREALRRGAVAVGECGLDYHYDFSPRDVQRRVFEQQLALAREFDKPVVVHTREAEADTIAMVREAGTAGVRGVLHCFTGSRELAETALDAGWSISFSGVVTFKSFTDDALLRLVPADRLLVESDAPYLAPVPYRGKRNEPAWVANTVTRIAAARGLPVERVGALTLENTRRFFGWPT